MPEQTTAKQTPMQRVESTPVELMERVEIDAQIATAHHYPRPLDRCRSEAIAMATVDKETADSCSYTVPRDGKQITGPSVRLAEIIASTWTNLRVATRFISEDRTHVTVQGVCHDLQTNVAIAKEVRRRITNKQGKRYTDDMVMTTSNAAQSIALRNAIVAVVPKAHWLPVYDAAMEVAAGDPRELPSRRAGMLSWFTGRGIAEAVLLKLLGKNAVTDIGLEDLLAAQGIRTAIQEQSTTVDELIASVEHSTGQSSDEMLEASMRKVPTADAEPEAVAEPGSETAKKSADDAVVANTIRPPQEVAGDEPVKPPGKSADALKAFDRRRRKVVTMFEGLTHDKRAAVVDNVNGLAPLDAKDTLKKTLDPDLLTAVEESIRNG